MRVCKHGCGVKMFCFSRATPLVFISGYANTENVFYCLSGTVRVRVYHSRDSSPSVSIFVSFDERFSITGPKDFWPPLLLSLIDYVDFFY